MEILFPDKLLELLMISTTFSAILMMFIQKLKSLSFINKSWHVWFLNLIFSFLLGIPFTLVFYELDIISGIWVSIFSFIGASGIYELLKNQNIINYTPNSVSDTITIPKDKEIKR